MPFNTIPPFPGHATEFTDVVVKNALNNIVTGYNGLQNLFAINGTSILPGIIVKTGTDASGNATFNDVTITAGSNITVTNGNGVSGNPIIAFSGYPSGVNLSYPTQFPLEATNVLLGAPLMTFYKTSNQAVTGSATVLATITIPTDLLQNGDGVILRCAFTTGAGNGTVFLFVDTTQIMAITPGTSVASMSQGETVITSGAGAFTSMIAVTPDGTGAVKLPVVTRTTGTLVNGLASTSFVIKTTGTFTLDMLTLIYNRGGSL